MAIEINHHYELCWLPGEIWFNIFETHQLHGGQTDDDQKRHERSRLDTLLSISSTCRGFYHLVRPILYRTLDFTIHINHAGLTLLVDTLVEDADVWQYVLQVRIPGPIYWVKFPGLELGTGAFDEEKSKLVVHLEVLGISSDLIHDIIQDNLHPIRRGRVVAAVLLCLCRNVRTYDLASNWAAAETTSLSPLLRKTFSERHRTPSLTTFQARPKLLLDHRPCAEIRSMLLGSGKRIEIEELGVFLALPSLLSLNLSSIYTVTLPKSGYKHLKPLPSWHLQSLKIKRCTMHTGLVVDVTRACRLLRFLDIDFRHTPGRPPFRYDHLGENLVLYNRKLEVLVCRDYQIASRVGFLDGKNDSLRPLVSLRTLALPLDILWDLRSRTPLSFEDVLPTSLRELHIFAAQPTRGEHPYAQLFLELMSSQQYPELTCIRIGEHEKYAEAIFLNLESNSHGWKAERDMQTREYVYNRSIDNARQASNAIA